MLYELLPEEHRSRNISFNKLNQYILNSSYLKGTKNFISKGWVVYRYSNELLRTFYSAKQYAFYSENGEIKGAILISNTGYKDICWINYIDAENESIYKELINYAVSKALKDKCSRIQLLVPKIAELINFVDAYGFKSWEQNNDFLLYEMPEHLIKRENGLTWLENTVELLTPFTEQVVLSGAGEVPSSLDSLVRLADVPDVQGPLTGILAAMRWHPDACWLLLA